ncbi:Alpha/Beta hydrolase protein [Syncephalastrum racemosum]|uniref:Protein phosphatase methylesterase 1 n=1 Tax=Syncephalastrum racemosum TaxID=13706 RepID=A0A1X2HUI1_SYNRA|nr:Alpha/Beta hydrolase protein [Syncephalastrum racemosum]
MISSWRIRLISFFFFLFNTLASLSIHVKTSLTDVCSHIFRVYRAGPLDSSHPVFVMHHGAGHSGLSFALTAHYIREITDGQCSIIAIDARGHGDTRTADDNDFSLKRMSDDLIALLQQVFADRAVDLILVGHSMGGSVVTDVAQSKQLKNVVGLAVLDVVEGSAMDALASMTKILSTRPQHFSSVEQAIQWHVQSETLHNVRSAKVSVPPLIRRAEGDDYYRWRTDLTKTTPFWTEWFENLSPKFLACPSAKLLILAGTDRLDKSLTIAQMQGKFQLHIIPEAGHFLQEDEPQRTAQCLVEFWQRNKRLVLPPKVQVSSKKPTEKQKK